MKKNKEEKEEKEKKYIFRKFCIFLVLIIILLVLYSRYVGVKGLIVKEYKIETSYLPSNFNGLKIAHFSDLYYKNTTDESDLEKLKNKINELKPDIIVFTGNLYSSEFKLKGKDKEVLITFLNSLEATTGKYAVKGKNDFKIDYEEILKSSSFTLLDNSYELVYYKGLTPIFIGGVPSTTKDTLDLEKLFAYYKAGEEVVKTAKYKIVISSEGNVFKNILEYDNTVNLMLGGASLNGSVQVPFYGPLYLPKNTDKYYAPHYELDSKEIFISSGIGTDKIKFRFNNKPSFNFYRFWSI